MIFTNNKTVANLSQIMILNLILNQHEKFMCNVMVMC